MADSTINPTQMAQQLATAYTQAKQAQLTTQTKDAQNTAGALTKLQSALQTFRSALTGLSAKPSLLQQSATLSNTGIATASADSTAQAGSYSFFVEQVASASQVAYSGITAVSVVPVPGSLTLSMADGSTFSVDLSTADLDGDGSVSPAELARAINQKSDNKGKISASIVTVGGQTQLLLNAGHTGANSQITVDASGINDAGLKAAFGAPQQLIAAKDAIVWLGNQGSGIKMQQASNTFAAVQGVSLSVTHAQANGDAPITLSVGTDQSATAANVQNFVDAYNNLEKTLDDLTKPGDAKNGAASGPFASDSGVAALRSHLNGLLRQSYQGLKLLDLGVSQDRYGNLALDRSKLQTALAAHPDALDKVFGNAQAGLVCDSNKYLNLWLNSGTGQIKRRQDSVQTLQKDLASRQSSLDNKYNQMYQRYLAQFSRLQALQAQMSQTSSSLNSLNASAA